MTKKLKQLLFPNYKNYKTKAPADRTLRITKEWLQQYELLFKGTSGEYLLNILIEELNQ